jgi:hypothetical protein
MMDQEQSTWVLSKMIVGLIFAAFILMGTAANSVLVFNLTYSVAKMNAFVCLCSSLCTFFMGLAGLQRFMAMYDFHCLKELREPPNER